MSTNKSEIINLLSKNYPNFLKKDVRKVFEIFISELRNSLKRHERVELRDVFTMEPRLNKGKVCSKSKNK